MAESPPASVFISPPAALMIDKSAAAHLRSDCRSFPAAVLILSELNCILLLFRLPAAVVMIRSLPAGIPEQRQDMPVYVSPGRAS